MTLWFNVYQTVSDLRKERKKNEYKVSDCGLYFILKYQ